MFPWQHVFITLWPTSVHSNGLEGRGTDISPFTTTFGEKLAGLADGEGPDETGTFGLVASSC